MFTFGLVVLSVDETGVLKFSPIIIFLGFMSPFEFVHQRYSPIYKASNSVCIYICAVYVCVYIYICYSHFLLLNLSLITQWPFVLESVWSPKSTAFDVYLHGMSFFILCFQALNIFIVRFLQAAYRWLLFFSISSGNLYLILIFN